MIYKSTRVFREFPHLENPFFLQNERNFHIAFQKYTDIPRYTIS